MYSDKSQHSMYIFNGHAHAIVSNVPAAKLNDAHLQRVVDSHVAAEHSRSGPLQMNTVSCRAPPSLYAHVTTSKGCTYVMEYSSHICLPLGHFSTPACSTSRMYCCIVLRTIYQHPISPTARK